MDVLLRSCRQSRSLDAASRVVGLALLWLANASCGSKGAVALTPSISDPAASIERGSLASRLMGSFTLHLELGPAAPSGTDVSLSQANFSLVRSADQSTLIVLKLSAEPTPPYRLEPGGKLAVKLTIADDVTRPGQIIADESAAICAVRDAVQIAGSITDGASGQPTPVSSLTFAVTGCP